MLKNFGLFCQKVTSAAQTPSVRLDDEFVEDVKIHSAASHRTVPKQIEHWAKIGQIVEDNPDLTYEFIREALIAREAVTAGKVTRYVRRTKRAAR
jgi:hypothetical protein